MEWAIKNRKGEATDTLTFAFWIFVVAIIIVFLVYAFTKVFTALGDTALAEDNSTLSAMNSAQNYVSTGIPSTFVIIFFGLLMGMLISSFFIRVHPIFIPIYILMAIATIIVTVALGNVWGNLKDFDDFNTVLETNSVLGMIDLVISNIVIVSLVFFIISLIVIFAKPSGGGQGGPAPY